MAKRRFHGEAPLSRRETAYKNREQFAGEKMTNEMNSADGSMVIGESDAFAHMPQQVIMKAYPSVYGYPDTRLMNNSDNMKGIDDQIGSDLSGARKHVSRTKY